MIQLEPTATSWKETIAQKRALRDSALAPFLVAQDDLESPTRAPVVENVSRRSELLDEVSISTSTEEGLQTRLQGIRITEIDDIWTLKERLRRGEVLAEDVVFAYIKRATIAHQLTNSFTEVVFEDALSQARELDEQFRRTGTIKGPLHGIPVTVKDQFNVRGVDTTLGYVGRAFKPATDDAVLVKLLKRMGAVIIAKTNLPQSIMWCETDNPLWGRTNNPRNPEFTPGGSTGGEAALLALKGSILGFGTDIGGSVRIPQAIVGLYGFKPSSSRLPYEGVPVSTEGQEHVPSSVGPMTRNLSSMVYITRLLVDSQPWTMDPRCTPLSWREDMFQETQKQGRPLTIGLITDDEVVRVHPPIAEALKDLTEKLKAAGHEIVDWNSTATTTYAPSHKACIDIMDQYYTADGGEDIRRDIEAGGEPYIPHVEALVNRGSPISVYEYWQLNRKKHAAQKKYLDAWTTTRSASTGRLVDVLLAPTLPHVAVPHRSCRWVGYTKIWNFLDYPALTFPVGAVCRSETSSVSMQYAARNSLDAWNWGLYNPESMKGHPIGLQIIGRKLEEEKVLGAAVTIEKVYSS